MRGLRLLCGPDNYPLLYSCLLVLGILTQISCLSQPTTTNTSPTLVVVDQHHHDDSNTSVLTIKRSVDDQDSNGAQHNEQVYSSLAAGFLLLDATDARLNLSDPIDGNLSKILDRDGPDMRPSRNYHDFKDITMDISKRAWSLLHDHVSAAVRQQAELAWPALRKLLVDARVSGSCTNAIQVLLEGAKQMDSWALQLLNSWGQFPMSGIYEGTYGSLGSFHSCVDIKENKFIGHAHYCSVTFRPIMPSQKDYELIVRKEPAELRDMFERLRIERVMDDVIENFISGEVKRANLTLPKSAVDYGAEASHSSDAFTDILEHAQYHHFIYYKLGTCWPIQCSPFDVRRVAKLFARRSILLNGPVKCYSRFKDDYEQPDEVEPGSDAPRESAATISPAGPVGATTTNPLTNGTEHQGKAKKGRKLVISVWDKNNGIFIWKPHFNTSHKVAISIILAVTAFIVFMTTIDILFVRLPPLYLKFLLCLRARPMDYQSQVLAYSDNLNNNNNNHNFSVQSNSFALCGQKQHPTQAGFALVPNDTQGGVDDEAELAPVERLSPLPPPPPPPPAPKGLFLSIVDDFSAITNVAQFFRVSEGQMRNDILCLNGVRCITMIWIILTHTMMYNDWSAFARTRSIEVSLNSLLSQPLFNGSYLVDTFFLMSGLLSAFTAFKHCQGKSGKFNSFAFIFGRWLRLTPQILFISMLYILFPTLSYGPHWYPMVGEYSENCVKNWWINVLHVQAFYKKEEMCNFVTWWISIDFFYHFFALAVIWVIILAGHKLGSLSIGTIIGGAVLWQSLQHYRLALPPNVLSTIPQTGAMWSTMTLDFYWTPCTHTIPFFFGFYIGYLMALKQKLITRFLNTRRALIGWIVSVSLFVGQAYSTYWWVTGRAEYSRLVSTAFFGLCSFIWAGTLSWTIIACHHGYGGFVNRVLSWRVFIVLGKSSYLIYLSHFMVLFVYFGNQNVFVEPSTLNMLYIVIGNIFMSTLWGVLLCSVYEIPWLKMHRRLMKYV